MGFTEIIRLLYKLRNKMAEKVGVSAGESILQFLPFVSRLETGFWHELGQRKLEKYKLSEEQKQIFGSYFNCEILYQGARRGGANLMALYYSCIMHSPL